MASKPLTGVLQETLALFDGSGEPRTTPEVAERLDLGRRSTYDRLERLVNHGRLETKKVGANARVWWKPPSSLTHTDHTDSGQDREEFESLIDAVEEYAIFMLDTEGYVQTWNPGAELIKGYTADEILGEHFSSFYTDEDCAASVPERNLAEAARRGSVEDEGWRVRNDGSTFWANVTITAIRDDDGDLDGYAKVTRDMTDRREYEQQLREEKAFIESILDTQQDLIYAFDTDGTPLRWNDSFRKVTGYTDGEIEEMRPVEFIADEAADEVTAATKRVFEQGDCVAVELPIEPADGEKVPYEFTGGPITDESGETVGLTGIGRDISDRKARERQLERQRDDLRSELEDIFTRIDEGFFALDDDWRLTYVNDHAAELVRIPPGELLGARVRDALPEVADGYPREMAGRAMESQESVDFEFYSEMLDSWTEVRIYPSESGLSVYLRDITERKERERKLAETITELRESEERLRLSLETGEMGTWELDLQTQESPVRTPQHDRIFGYEELLDDWDFETFLDHVHPDDREQVEQSFTEASESGEWDFECQITRVDGEERAISAQGEFRFDSEGEPVRAVGVVQDITDRKERERELEQCEEIIESVNDGVYVVDADRNFQWVNEAYAEMIGYSREELRGENATMVVADDDVIQNVEVIEEEQGYGDLPRMDIALRTATGERVAVEATSTVLPRGEKDGWFRAGVVRDITERKKRERKLERALDLLERTERIADVGGWEIDVTTQDVFWTDHIFDLLDVSSDEEPPLDEALAMYHEEDQPVVEDAIEEALDSGDPFDVEARIRTGDGERRWLRLQGVPETIDGDTVSLRGAAQDTTERKERERELERQREQLAALNNLNEVVRDITDAVIDQSTRAEIEEIVCERLAEADSYEFAWIAGVNPRTMALDPHVEAGVDGYLEGVPSTSMDQDEPSGQGPAGRAVRRREIQTTQDVFADPDFEPWREYATEYGYRSAAAIPIVHDETLYGLIGVYADRLKAFESQEQEVIGQVGEIVGHAIAAIERKRALMSEEVTEIEFSTSGILDTLGVDSAVDGTITFDRTVPIGDDTFLQYGAVDEGAIPTLEALVDQLSHCEDLSLFDRGDDTSRFELRLSEPPIVSVIASRGGYLQQTTIEDGDLHMTVHLPQTVDASKIIDTVQEIYPTTELLRQRQITRSDETLERVHRAVIEDLTERQRTALETAVYVGFFEWPRDATGEDIAERLGIAPPTFHQHLRKAQRKVFESVFSAPASI